MANIYESQVITYLKRKENGDFGELMYLAPEQRYVAPLRNSGVNNLEEQYIIGIDSYCEGHTDESGNKIITRIFCKDYNPDGENTEYYKLTTTLYAIDIASSDYFQEEESAYLSTAYDAKKNSLLLKGNLYDRGVKPQEYVKIKQEELVFVREGQEIPVTTKITERKFDKDGTKEILRQRIENHLIKE